MEVSKQAFGEMKTWKRQGLDLDIYEINRTFKFKKPKILEIAIQDTLIQGERYGICARKGKYRKDMEDTFAVKLELQNNSFKHAFALFDGHSGNEASLFASRNLIENIESLNETGVVNAFKQTDYDFCNENPSKGGTTASLAIINHAQLITANIGDTKIVLVQKDTYEVLSYDHIASDPDEQQRIEKAGGYIINRHNTNRVCGQLSITRSIGDARLKDYIISTPAFRAKKLSSEDIALVIASDGLFEFLTPKQVSDIVREKQSHSPLMIAETLVQEALDEGSKDNVSVMIIRLEGFFTLACSQTDRNKQKAFEFP